MARLQLTTIHLNDTQQERIWAMVAAYKVSASIQQIAATADLSSNRLHQLLVMPRRSLSGSVSSPNTAPLRPAEEFEI